MATGPDNSDESAAASKETPGSNYGKAVAILSFPIAAIPSCVMLYWLGEQFVALYGSPTTSYRPILGVQGVWLTLLTVVISIPLSLLADRLGTKTDSEFTLRCFWLAPVPSILGILGPIFVCWATGSSFGT